VPAVRRLVKAVAGTVDMDRFGLGRSRGLHLHAHGAFEDVADHRAWMTMRCRGFAGAVSDLNHLEAEVGAVEPRKGLVEHGTNPSGGLVETVGRVRGSRWRIGRQRRVADDGEDIGPAFYESHCGSPSFAQCGL
jgi:hypothetical protein